MNLAGKPLAGLKVVELGTLIAGPFAARICAEFGAEVPASRIYSAEDMFTDPQFLAREMFLSAKLPDGKSFKMPGIVPKLSATPGSVDAIGPALGEHNRELLSALGYSGAQIDQLQAAGAI